MADEVIGRADYELRARLDQLRKDLAEARSDVAKSGAAAEKDFADRSGKWGPKLASGVKVGVAALGTAAAGMFAIATKGALELEEAQARYQAETGASAEEAERAGRVINRVAGANRLSLEAVSEAAIAVHNDLGATGDVADRLTEKFARFGRVTRQEPVAAVKAFDDILDAWGLTVEDSDALMDKLIASHQKFGGAIADDQAALAALAPALRAMNGSTDDAIALMDLFKASGIDSAAAVTGLSKALQTVKSPAELQRLIDDISATVDPLLRAQKAADLFGAKAGPKLANALAGKHLEDFRISVDESTGSLDKAADALDSTFGAKFQKMLSEAGATLRGLGKDWGPLLSGGASAASLVAGIFGPEAIRKLSSAAVGAFKEVGSRAGDALSDGMQSVFTGAGGTVAGNTVASRMEIMLDPERNSRVSAALRAAAAKAGALWGVAFGAISGVGGALVNSLTAAISASALAGPVRAAILATAIELGTLQGTRFAQAFGVAAAAAAIAVPVTIFVVNRDAILEALPGDNAQGILETAQKNRQALVDSGQAVWIDANKAITPVAVDTSKEVGEAAGKAVAIAYAATITMQQQALGAKVGEAISAALGTATAVAGAKMVAAAVRYGREMPQRFADSIRSKRDTVDQAWQALLDAIHNGMKPAAERAKLVGELVSKQLVWGLKSKDPAVRNQARATKQVILDRLAELGGAAAGIGRTGMDALRKAMQSKDKDIRHAAWVIYQAAKNPISKLPGDGTSYGSGLVKNLIAGMNSQQKALAAAAAGIAGIARDYFQLSSPAKLGPWSRMGGPEGWGKRFTSFLTKGIASGMPALNALLDGLPTGPADPFLLQVAGSAPVQRVRVEHTIDAKGAQALAQAGFDDRQVAAAMVEGADASGLFSHLRGLQAMSGS